MAADPLDTRLAAARDQLLPAVRAALPHRPLNPAAGLERLRAAVAQGTPWSRSTTTQPAGTQIAAVLDGAADHIDRVGHHQGWLYNEDQAARRVPLKDCASCAAGAINFTVYGSPGGARAHMSDEQVDLARAAELALLDTILELGGWTGVGDWNDHPGTTHVQVTDALRATAVTLRGGGA